MRNKGGRVAGSLQEILRKDINGENKEKTCKEAARLPGTTRCAGGRDGERILRISERQRFDDMGSEQTTDDRVI